MSNRSYFKYFKNGRDNSLTLRPHRPPPNLGRKTRQHWPPQDNRSWGASFWAFCQAVAPHEGPGDPRQAQDSTPTPAPGPHPRAPSPTPRTARSRRCPASGARKTATAAPGDWVWRAPALRRPAQRYPSFLGRKFGFLSIHRARPGGRGGATGPRRTHSKRKNRTTPAAGRGPVLCRPARGAWATEKAEPLRQ